jgi:hypothetical protein
MFMIKMEKIAITRGEGLITECGKTYTVHTWEEANRVLQRMAMTAPDRGYDKTDFEVTYTDGETYTGRYDLKRHDVQLGDLGRHIRQICEFNAGLYCPSHMTPEQYQRILDRDKELVKEYKRFLDNYEIG